MRAARKQGALLSARTRTPGPEGEAVSQPGGSSDGELGVRTLLRVESVRSVPDGLKAGLQTFLQRGESIFALW